MVIQAPVACLISCEARLSSVVGKQRVHISPKVLGCNSDIWLNRSIQLGEIKRKWQSGEA